MTYEKILESDYGDAPHNFHVAKGGDELHVTLTYPPWTDADNKTNQCRYVVVNQEAVRASDGVRLHYDYARDGFVIEQRKPYLARKDDCYYDVDNWTEVGFFQSWALDENACEGNSPEQYQAADEASEPIWQHNAS